MEDDYKKIGTSKEAVEYDMDRKKRDTEGKLEFIKEKFESKMKKIKNSESIARNQNDQKKLVELNGEAEASVLAYDNIKFLILKQKHQQNSAKKTVITRVSKKKTPYEVLNLFKESMKYRSAEKNDAVIKERRDEALKNLQKKLQNVSDFKEKLRIEAEIKEIEEAYEMIKTEDKRKVYIEQEQKKDEEEKQKVRTQKIKEKYCHSSEYTPYLIRNRQNSGDKSLQNKMIERKEELSEEYSYIDKENRQLRIRQTAKINFENWTGVNKFFINEYEVIRKINGEEKKDIIYMNLAIRDLKIDLSVDKKTSKPINPDYYDCFVNKLLAEETIEGSKYNEGFIGGIGQNREGNYYITLEKDCLSPMEQEQMTAVMIMKQKERNIHIERGEYVI